ncbi:hypothetical protein ANN_01736 [Periplaneta americana]|uniref:Uncharacterized protein n=1 Tax=Periplaneta americana TaxID=6978 RepID=A0ABQ8TWR5_PERAM|nr:hypothetical protein ANN_01736 [Periplaneta americana]
MLCILDNGNIVECYVSYILINIFLLVPSKCSPRAWVFERVPGYELIGFNSNSYPAQSREECMSWCFSETDFECRSAEFTFSARTCVLSNQDRHTQPDSYIATTNDVEYLENLCVDPSPSGQTCAFEEHQNRTLEYRDLEFQGISQDECHDKCINETNFICRALTFLPFTTPDDNGACYLHSDDTVSLGPGALKPYPGATYLERAPCLNLTVICSEDSINVTLRTVQAFGGQIYVNGYADACHSRGNGGLITTLSIPLSLTGPQNPCGIMIVKSVGTTNRYILTLMSTVVVVQRNPFIQRRGDRAIKVGCLLGGSFSPTQTVNTSITITGPDNVVGGGTTVLNSTSVTPVVQIRIIDPTTGNSNTKETQLGQELQLRIDVQPDNGPFDITAGHLIATNADGTETIFLLNERGCPPDTSIFPAFTKAGPNSKSLVANFRAFKFFNSLVVRFIVMVQFCPDTCPRVDCGNGIFAYGRRKRESAGNGTEMPLQTTLIVHSPQLLPSSLIQGPDTNGRIIVGIEDTPGSVCVYFGAIIGLVIAWLLLQFLILIGCYIVVRERYKRKREEDSNSMQHKLEDDFNGFENNRHVHWADEGR